MRKKVATKQGSATAETSGNKPPRDRKANASPASEMTLREAVAAATPSMWLRVARDWWRNSYEESPDPLSLAVRDVLTTLLLAELHGDREGLKPLHKAAQAYRARPRLKVDAPDAPPISRIDAKQVFGKVDITDRAAMRVLGEMMRVRSEILKLRRETELDKSAPTMHEDQRKAIVELDNLIESAISLAAGRATSGRALRISHSDVESLVVTTYEIILKPLMFAKFLHAGCVMPDRAECVAELRKLIKNRDEEDTLGEGGAALLKEVARKFGAKGRKATNLLGASRQKAHREGKSQTTPEG